LIAQIIKGLILTSGDRKFLDFKAYSFSGLKGQTKVSRSGLHYNSNRVTLVISSVSHDFIHFILGRIFDQKELEIGLLVIVPESVDQEIAPSLDQQEKFICISPLVVLEASFNSEEGKLFVDPSSDEFSDHLYHTTLKRMESAGIVTREIAGIENFQLVPDSGYIRKVTDSGKKFARIYQMFDQDVKFEVRGYTFPFELYAPAEVQEFVFTCGLGSYCQKGFGMLDLANTNPVERTIPHEIPQLKSA
jgi:CRISPR-associated endoribonuclease Cas6